MLFNEPKLLKFRSREVLPARTVRISVLFNEPKLLKFSGDAEQCEPFDDFSALQRAEIAEISFVGALFQRIGVISVLFNEPKLLKFVARCGADRRDQKISVLFNEPKLLKLRDG